MFVKAEQLEHLGWSSPFSAVDAVTATEVTEAHVLRAPQRLDKLLRQVCAACRAFGSCARQSQPNLRSQLANQDVSYGSCFARPIVPTIHFAFSSGDFVMRMFPHHLCTIFILILFLAPNVFPGPAPKGHPKISKTKSVEKTLIRMLIDRYQRFGLIGRPIIDNKKVLKVRYGLQLIQILDLDENKQILHTNCWSNYNWNDTLLQWDPVEYANISEVRIFPSQVWTPDIQLYNFADQRSREHRIARVVVHADGNILWVPQALFKSACQVEITFFPFDTQIKSYIRYQERNQTEGNVVTTKKYTVLCYRIRLYRNPSFYIFMLVAPCILLSSLTTVVFWLPPESPAKMMLGMNIFVSFFLLLLLLAGQTPNAVKEFPLIGAFFCLNMIMVTLSTFHAAFVIHFHFRGARNGPLPAILHRIIIEGMGRLMLVRQSIPFPEEKKTLSHVVSLTTSGVVTGLGGAPRGYRRRKVRVPELPSDKFLEDYDDDLETGGGYFNNNNAFSNSNNESPRRQPFGSVANYADGSGGWKNHMSATGNRASYGGPGTHTTCPGCMGLDDSMGDLSHRSGHQNWRGGSQFPEVIRGGPSANAPNLELEDSPIMLSSSTSLERDVREVKRYMRMFVNRQKEGARKNAIAMEWRTMAMILDRFLFFVYIATIGITVITAMPRKHRPEGFP
ncbi:hypothetical protein Aperf_G00000015684 [Anoplocephala perfoliata]